MGEATLNKYSSIRLNGVLRKGEDLISFCEKGLKQSDIPEWLKDVYQFILEWVSSDEYIIAHTSGSTGQPKKVKLEKKHMIASAKKTIDYFALTPEKTALLCLSANYIAGKMMLVRAFVGGFNLWVVEPSGTPLKGISESLDFLAMVPLQVFNSLADFSVQIKNVIIGGGAVSNELKGELLRLPTMFYETYGMTETVSHVAIKKISAHSTTFKAMPNVKFDTDERGCLKIMAPDISEQTIVTNDIVRLTNDQEFQFLGRYDNIINTGGVKVIPEEVEAKLAPQIMVPFLVSAVPDNRLGEKLVLVIEESSELNDLDYSELSKFETPRDIIAIQAFPLTDTGKIKRAVLKNSLVLK
ncbi:AMP-binding protein [Labilibacter marinus]|uniref:AMP-binding protein n=1 Tax=Labilibacter marinus TaxID=1477105 RepID=UPI00083558F0|nr:AMP-binding protein [Labilibacter marinus]